MAPRPGLDDTGGLGSAEDTVEVGDPQAEVGSFGRDVGELVEVDLLMVIDRDELSRKAEVGRGRQTQPDDLGVERHRGIDISDHQVDVLDVVPRSNGGLGHSALLWSAGWTGTVNSSMNS